MGHDGPAIGHADFGVTDRSGIGPMHANGERATSGSVGAMQPTKPFEAPGGFLTKGGAKCFRAHALRFRLVVAGRNPLLRDPGRLMTSERAQIPPPFMDLPLCRKNPNEAERVDSRQWLAGKKPGNLTGRALCRHGLNHQAATDGSARDCGRHGIPVDQCERGSRVVGGDPGSTTGLGGTEHPVAIHRNQPG